MELTWLMYVIVLPLVFLGGFIDAAAGGGGLITLPAYLLAGLPPQLASGSNKASAMCGTTAALIRYQRSGKIDWRAAIPAMLLALPGSFIGARIQMLLLPVTVRIIIGILLPLVAIPLLRKNALVPKTTLNLSKKAQLTISCVIGFTIGMYDGFFGPGTGTFLLIAFTYFCGMDPVTASGSAKVVNLASNVAAFVAFAIGGQVLFALALPAALFSIAGGTLGAHMTVKKGTKLIKPVIFIVLVILLIKIILDIISSIRP